MVIIMPKLKRPIYGYTDPRGPTEGRDVKAVQIMAKRLIAKRWPKKHEVVFPKSAVTGKMNNVSTDAIKLIQRWHPDIPTTGNVGQKTLDILWPHANMYARWLYRTFEVPKQEYNLPKLPLVEPHQGFDSLHQRLWQAYSLGRKKYGFKDGPGYASGTYNPNSRLPSGALSDHALYPSRAFDLDIVEHTGWNNLKAREYFLELWEYRKVYNINYIILGNKIVSVARASEGIRTYSPAWIHANHIHVSTWR